MTRRQIDSNARLHLLVALLSATLTVIALPATAGVAGPATPQDPAPTSAESAESASSGEWSPLHVREAPSERSGGAIAYDERTSEVVLFGGGNRTGKLADTWTRTGVRWGMESPPSAPEPLVGTRMVYDPLRDHTLLFGGHADAGRRGETWAWDGVTWTRLSPESSPPARSYHSMTFDEARGEIVLFGGFPPTGGGALADTWIWDGVTWTEANPATSPSARTSASLTYDAAREEVVLFGGSGGGSPLGDTWAWDGVTWTQLSPPTSPSARNSASFAYDGERAKAILFGGIDRFGYLSDTWEWDGTTWLEQHPSTAPPRRSSSHMVYDSGARSIMLFGGKSANLIRNGTWLWDGTDWTSVDEPRPEARFSSMLGYDAARGELVLFGGSGDGGTLNDTWVWDGSWAMKDPATKPGPRSDAAAAYDAARAEWVLFGGFGPGGSELGDTWIWDGSGWTQRETLVAPLPRHNAVMTYDPRRHEVVLWGGYNRNLGLFLTDTWTWNGARWNKEDPGTSPPGRSGAVMTYDEARDTAVMFGGYNSSVRPTSDTWLWDGSTWTEVDPATSPPARVGAAMTYDAELDAPLLFGGNKGLGKHLADTWIWTGETWREAITATVPPPRFGGALAYHPRRAAAILFGGNSNRFLADTWAWSASQVGEPDRGAPDGRSIFRAEGEIELSNPIAAAIGGITEDELALTCSYPPATQDLDGHVFDLPDGFGAAGGLAAVTGSNELDLYDLDLTFYSKDCSFFGASATEEQDEEAALPTGTKFVVVNAAIGSDTRIALKVTSDALPASRDTALAFTKDSAAAGQYSDSASIEVRLSDDQHSAVAAGEVLFELVRQDNAIAWSATASSDPQGRERVEMPLTEHPGTYTLMARYGGEPHRFEPTQAMTSFVIQQEDTAMDLEVEGQGSRRTLNATLSDLDRGAAVEDRSIDFYGDGEHLGTATTDASGTASLQAPPRYRGRDHHFEARFIGDDYYLASSSDGSEGSASPTAVGGLEEDPRWMAS